MQKPESNFASVASLDEFIRENPGIGFIDAMFPDMCGIIRGKRLTVEHARQLFSDGLQIPGSMLLLSVTGGCLDPLGRGVSDGDPDVLMRPISGSLRLVPWVQPPRAQVQVSFLNETGGRNEFDPRQILAQIVDRFDELGVRPIVACEIEFCLIDPEVTSAGSPRRPALHSSAKRHSNTQLMSLSYVDDFGPFVEKVTSACREFCLPLTAINAEYGGDQFEINLHHVDDAVQSADYAINLKQIVQGIAAEQGMRATFMAKPYEGKAGSGMHWHVSMLDGDGENLFDDSKRGGRTALKHAVAGVLETMPEAMAFVAPNINSYKRFRPGIFVPMTRSWGFNNRSVAIRIPAGNSDNRRIEYRLPGADANPYLALAVLLAGLHYGMARKLTPPKPIEDHGRDESDQDLPLKLYDALNALTSATVLPEYLGSEYCSVYAECKRLEMEEFLDGLSAKEFQWYLRPDS